MKDSFWIIIFSFTVSGCKKNSNTAGSVVVLPTVTTELVNSITISTAVVGGNVSNDGGGTVTLRGVCWSTSHNPAIAGNHTTDGMGNGMFTSNISGLLPLTTYYVRAFATNSAGTGYGAEVPFVSSTGTVNICGVLWMNSNLNVATYRNGDTIPKVSADAAWSNLTTGAYCYYKNDSATYAAIYGKLYNWHAVNDPRGLAPLGWHIPGSAEWTNLANCFGGSSIAGGPLKEAGFSHWLSPNTGATNSSGFNGLPSGYRANTGAFSLEGMTTQYWSSAQLTATESLGRALFYGQPYFSPTSYLKVGGYAIRLVKN